MGQDGARREIRQAFHPSGASGVSIPGSGWGKLSMRHVCPAIFPFREYSPFSLQARTWNDFRAAPYPFVTLSSEHSRQGVFPAHHCQRHRPPPAPEWASGQRVSGRAARIRPSCPEHRPSFPRHHPPVRNGVRVCGVIRQFSGRPIDDETT